MRVDDRLILEVYLSQYHLPAVAVADRLGMYPVLRHARTAAQVADELDLDPTATAAVLGLLSGLGVLARHDDAFHLTATAQEFLLPESPHYWGPMLRLGWDEKCSALRESVRRGLPFGYRGRDIWEVHRRSSRQAELFAEAMQAHSAAPAAALAGAAEPPAGALLDVGGGSGAFAMAFAQRWPDLSVTILDLPAVRPVAEKNVHAAGVADRVGFLAADMFHDPWPERAGTVLFANVFSDWSDDGCSALARRAHQALRGGGTVLVHGVLVDDSGCTPLGAASYGVSSVVLTEGRPRTFAETAAILRAAGFTDCRLQLVFGLYSVISAQRKNREDTTSQQGPS
jgi:hypothetical protein